MPTGNGSWICKTSAYKCFIVFENKNESSLTEASSGRGNERRGRLICTQHKHFMLIQSRLPCIRTEKNRKRKNSAISLRSFVRSKNHARANARYHAPRSKPEHTKMHETLTFTFNMFLQPPPTFILLLTLIMNFKEFHRNKKKQKKKQFISEQIHFPRKKELNQKFVGNEISLNISIENLKFRKCTLKNILQSQCKRRNWIYFHSIRREIYFTRRHIEFSNELRHLKIEWSKP